jgi:hypothetical protein
VRVFKNKWFDRWARGEAVTDVILCGAAKDIEAGRVEADLGGNLFKKRLPRPGAGKSGSYRVVVGYRKPNTARIIFLYAFAKNAKANMSAKEEAALSLVAESFVSATDKQVQTLLTLKTIKEVQCHD